MENIFHYFHSQTFLFLCSIIVPATTSSAIAIIAPRYATIFPNLRRTSVTAPQISGPITAAAFPDNEYNPKNLPTASGGAR